MVKVETNMVVAQVQEPSPLLNYINTYIKTHFTNTISMTNSTIIFPKDEELSRRKILLSVLTNTYVKTRPQALQNMITTNIMRNIKLPIKLQFVRENAVAKVMRISIIRLGKDVLILKNRDSNKLFAGYFKTFFKDSIVRIREDENALTLQLDTLLSLSKFERLLNRRVVISSFIVQFLFNKDEMDKFFADNRTLEEEYHKNLPIKKFLEILNCSLEDNFDTIKAKYISLIKEYHPDRVFNKEDTIIEEYTKKFQLIQEAFESIKEFKSNS